jgi:hypothetical protein
MICKMGAQRLTVPRPAAFSSHIARHRGVNGCQTTTTLDKITERRLLLFVQDVSRGTQEDHDLVFSQFRLSEHRWVFRCLHHEIVFRSKSADGCDAIGDRCVAKHQGAGKYQCLERFCRGLLHTAENGRKRKCDSDEKGTTEGNHACSMSSRKLGSRIILRFGEVDHRQRLNPTRFVFSGR